MIQPAADPTFARLTATMHVPCPDCAGPTYAPYWEPRTNDYFDGFYCEACGSTWRWNAKARRFDSSFG